MTSSAESTSKTDPAAEDLLHDPEDATAIWQEAARVLSLHRELANLYRNRSKDTRTIRTLWSLIEEGEADLAARGVYL